MELRHLRYFVAVAETLNYRKAAEGLRIAQPALSKQIMDLEQSIGARLLDRSTAGVALTDAGTIFLEEARDILERVDMACTAARDAGAGLSGRLVIANLGSAIASFLPPALSSFRTRYPLVDVNIRDLSLPDQMSALKAGIIQVGFAINGSGLDTPSGIESEELITTRLTIACCYQHRFAQKAEVSLSDLMEESILCAEGPNRMDLHRQRTLRVLSNRGIVHRPIKLVSSWEALVTLVAGNHGVAILIPSKAAQSTGRVLFKPIKEAGNDLIVTISVLWRKGSSSQLARNFVDVLKTIPLCQKPECEQIPFKTPNELSAD